MGLRGLPLGLTILINTNDPNSINCLLYWMFIQNEFGFPSKWALSTAPGPTVIWQIKVLDLQEHGRILDHAGHVELESVNQGGQGLAKHT